MADKIDLVMWTKNGAETLSIVLKRLGEVMPSRFVKNRIIVDDHSTDGTRDIAESFGWQVISNQGTGIGDGANTALKNVETEYFASFEQDLLLAREWWQKVPSLLSEPNIVVASGLRFAGEPAGLKVLQQQMAKKCMGAERFWLSPKGGQQDAFTFGKTLDNTIYETKAIRGVGGFPRTSIGPGVDTILIYRLQRAGLHWAVDYNVQSIHLRGGLRKELSHQLWYGRIVREIWAEVGREFNLQMPSESNLFYRLIMSPLSGLASAYKLREPSVIYIYPLTRLYYMIGLLTSRKTEKDQRLRTSC